MIRSLSPLKLILVAGLLGSVAGIGLSLRRQHVEEKKLRKMSAQIDKLAAETFPPAPPAPRKSAAMTVPLMDPAAMEGLPAYPNTVPRNLASVVKTQGMDLKVGWFTTRDSIDDVISFYERKFAEKGYLPLRHRYNPGAGYVGYLDMNDEKLRLLTLIHNKGETLVMPSVSYPGRMLQAKAPTPASLPVLPGANGSVVVDFDEGMNARSSYFATVGEMSLAQVVDFYKKGFVEKGWELSEINDSKADEVRIDARRGKSSCNVLLQKRAQKVAIYVSIAGQV